MFHPVTPPRGPFVQIDKSFKGSEITQDTVHHRDGVLDGAMLPAGDFRHGFLRVEDQHFYDECLKQSFVSMLTEIERSHMPPPEPLKFNGISLPQPHVVPLENAVEVDFYSDRPECVLEQAAIKAAEKVLENGHVSTRFAIIHGMAEGMPSDCFPDAKGTDPKFYVVDTLAHEYGKPACLLQCCVDRVKKEYVAIPFDHPSDVGSKVRDQLLAM